MNSTPHSPARLWLGIGAVLLLGFALRVWHLNDSELVGVTTDERWTYALIQRDFPGVIDQMIVWNEPHPPGSYFMFKAWSEPTGESAFALRFLPALFGVLAIALIWRLSRELGLNRYSLIVPFVAATLMAVSPVPVSHSREMRMYSMVLVWTIAGLLLMLALLRRPTPARIGAYVVINAAALYTHYFTAFLLVAQNVFVFGLALVHWRRVPLARWIIAQITLAAVYLPWLVFARSVFTVYGGTAMTVDPLRGLAVLLTFFAIGEQVPDWAALGLVLGTLLVIAGVVGLWRSGRKEALFLLLAILLIPVVLASILSQTRPVFRERYMMGSLTAFFLLTAVSAAWAWRTLTVRGGARRRWLFAVPALAIAVVLAAANARGLIEAMKPVDMGWRALERVIARYATAQPPAQFSAALNYPDLSFQYYYKEPYVVLPFAKQDQAGADAVVRELRARGVRRVAAQVLGPSDWDDSGILTRALTNEFTQVEEQWTGRWVVRVFDRAEPSDLTRMDAVFSDAVRLSGATIVPDLTGRLLVAHVAWGAAPGALSGREKAFIHVFGVANPGSLVAQDDVALTADAVSKPVNTYGLRLPDSLAPGTYRVIAGVYLSDPPAYPRLRLAGGADSVVLGEFTVH